ncbi:MAG: indolepyruvate ferredoxin oxidoreductase subunit alpha [Christensenellales bacterium]|jgi:indolepyruvate ferredoxin oxidoreductase alpha subunit
MQQLLMGNEAIALGAIAAGVNVVAGYPGTPSTEILETVAKHNPGDIYVEWSVNEKAALEVGAGAAYAGARVLVTMKQVGLNVASDPLMSLAYVGVKGGMVIVSADDPGPISSQTEQDTRHFARFSKLPVFDPASPEEAYAMIGDAFALSEKYQTPVLLRPTTRVCHGCASIQVDPRPERSAPEGFVKDSKWVIFPRLSYQNHLKIESRNRALSDELSGYRFNTLSGQGKLGVAVGGVSCAYMGEALLGAQGDYRLLKVGTPHPFPDALALRFLEGLTDVLVAEELDPVIERQLIYLCGKHHLPVTIHGKLDGSLPEAGEYSVELLRQAAFAFLSQPVPEAPAAPQEKLPVRPPVLCAGCPHRASFYAVKAAMKGRKAVFCGDIGCYTLGNSQPLDMVDTCLCMGADVTIAQGLYRVEPDVTHFSFIGDSTFFHTGIPGVVNAIYNQHRMVLIVLDNATTAMTGHQPHPGTGQTMMGNIVDKIDIAAVLGALGVPFIRTVDPLDHALAVATVREAADQPGVSAIIFRSPCIALVKNRPALTVSEACANCGRCIRELGCPALVNAEGHVAIEPSLCTGCGLCAQLCPVGAIGGERA